MPVEELIHFLERNNIPYIPIIASLLIILVGFFVHQIIFLVLGNIAIKKDIPDISIIKKQIKGPAMALIILFAFMVALPLLDALNTLRVRHMLSLTLIFFISWFVIRSLATIRAIILHRYDITIDDNLKARKISTQIKMLERIVVVIVLIIAIATGLMTFDKIRQVGLSMLASAGIAGIILGFAAQRSISTIIAGFQIAFTQPIRIDDVVIIEGEFGRVEEITLTYVVVRIWDKRRMVVPITFFIENPFQNWTRISADLMGTVFLYTDYTVPLEEIRKEQTRILESSPFWDKVANAIQVTDSRENTVELRCLMSAENAPNLWELRVLVREKLIEFLQKNYPQSLPRSRVELKPNEQQQRV